MPRTATLVIAAAILLGVANSAQETVSKGRYILAMGRRLPYVYAVSLDAALNPANDRTSKAIVARGKVATEGLDGHLFGDPANLVVSEDGRIVYVVNHQHGAIDNAAFRQHGGRGLIAVLDVDDLLSPAQRRHRQCPSAAHGLRRIRCARHRAPAGDAGNRQRREPPDRGRRKPHHLRRPANWQPSRHC